MSFFRTLIYFILGDLGRALLNFYQNNDVWINTIALIYGAVLIVSHRNLRNLVHQMEADILDIAGSFQGSVNYTRISQLLRQRWEEKYHEVKVYIPARTDLWLHRVKKSELLELLHIDGEYIKLALHRLSGTPDRKSFTRISYRVWDEYRHRLLTGIRSRIKDPEEILKQLEAQEKRARASRR